jgi:hypothetical protein
MNAYENIRFFIIGELRPVLKRDKRIVFTRQAGSQELFFLSSSLRRNAMLKTMSFSMVPSGPIAPGSFPP